MGEPKRVVTNIYLARHLAADLESLTTEVRDREITMTVMSGLPAKTGYFIFAVHAVADDNILTLEFVKSHLLLKDKFSSDRSSAGLSSGNSALVNNAPSQSRLLYNHYKKTGHLEAERWLKCSNLCFAHILKKMVAHPSGSKGSTRNQASICD